MASRRGFLGALAGLPFVGALVKAEPEVFVDPQPGPPGPVTPTKFDDLALLIWKDGRYERVYCTRPLGRTILKARWLRPQNTSAFARRSAPRFGVDMEQVAFRRNVNRSAFFSAPGVPPKDAIPIYEEV